MDHHVETSNQVQGSTPDIASVAAAIRAFVSNLRNGRIDEGGSTDSACKEGDETQENSPLQDDTLAGVYPQLANWALRSLAGDIWTEAKASATILLHERYRDGSS
jgi:hypothetical protein